MSWWCSDCLQLVGSLADSSKAGIMHQIWKYTMTRNTNHHTTTTVYIYTNVRCTYIPSVVLQNIDTWCYKKCPPCYVLPLCCQDSLLSILRHQLKQQIIAHWYDRAKPSPVINLSNCIKYIFKYNVIMVHMFYSNITMFSYCSYRY